MKINKEIFKVLASSKPINHKHNDKLLENLDEQKIEDYYNNFDCSLILEYSQDSDFYKNNLELFNDGNILKLSCDDNDNNYLLITYIKNNKLCTKTLSYGSDDEFESFLDFDNLIIPEVIPEEKFPIIKKDNLLIFLHKLNVAGKSPSNARQIIREYMEGYNSKVLTNVDFHVVNYFLPIKEGDSDIKCIYPVLPTESQYDLIVELQNYFGKDLDNGTKDIIRDVKINSIVK